ncbi:TIGR04197 family type VII secretion effector [Virgibacillus sp. C22-A2]|uniref:TIGR04197 family type VII secretion effector n=1 Tax=Virgibacillus tibetensis TaxID=3042313 RepID=A0ABU6KIP3_9BACI|nr:TIGR04197 family type VII secretion effector [Virgibacillus sp. C22-A2]
MIEEVGINLGEFQSNISRLRSSASGIESSIKTNRTFNKTNIEPFTNDLEHIIRAIELIRKYQTLLNSDIDTLEQTGEKMKENDERIAAISNIDVTGPQPLRT